MSKTNILLLLPPPFKEGAKGFSPRWFPLQEVQIATYLKQKNYEVSLIDAFVEDLSFPEIEKKAGSIFYDFIGLPLSILNREIPYELVLSLHNRLKQIFPKTKIILFNRFLPQQTEFFLNANPAIDYLLCGDVEETFHQLIECVLLNKELTQIKGLAWKNSAGYIIPQEINILNNLDLLPFPDLSFINFKAYAHIPHRYNTPNFYPMEAARGCYWNKCTFCFEARQYYTYRTRSPENIVSEIEQAREKYQASEIQFNNAQFPTEIEWLKQFLNLLLKKGIKIKWTCLSRVDRISKETLQIMKNAGCVNILFGLESFDPKALKFLKKGISLTQIAETIKNCNHLGIETTGSFQMGLPFETPLSVIKTALSALKMNLDYFQLFIMKWYEPELPEEIADQGTLSNTWDYTKYDFSGPVFLPKAYKNVKQLKRIKILAYLTFYLHPKTLAKFLKRLTSLSEFKRIFSGGTILLKMIFNPFQAKK